MNWRHTGSTSPGERVGGFAPCDDPANLCPSCAVFGSIDPREREKLEAADQRAYRGHVRFTDALAEGEPSGKPVTLPPMGAPRPGAGQAYLDNRKLADAPPANPALREWGAPDADGKSPRPLRGRKHYWQAAPNGREQPRPHHLEEHANLTAEAELFRAGTEFQTTIAFTDLSPAQLGGLIAALKPSALLEDDQVQTHLGGGKPLGFGQCSIELDLDGSEVQCTGARYGLDLPGWKLTEDLAGLLDAFRSSVRPEVRRNWPLIQRVLRPDAVPAELVWYPPGAKWRTRDEGDATSLRKFDEGFEFWKTSTGFHSGKESGGGHPLRSLPHLQEKPSGDREGYDQAMDIVEKDS